ncbi:hypothetical protein CHLRE_09g397800v5 [Chlamydomonas reinhardtii]|uniref:Uncharacterized protein n=1 Tax=Chlamydomonas reinhardtii TaxID=3055 RepID=A0A2K3DD21_CHLRE|nr:uncharacterized protein CHLRE_09g397800v5 [Chlamydomonas reinhardtii]PNW78429.1 hypothetical protein CHLRE_09g397800v5 [Chlamydomonas reinhardtii]
MEQLSSWKAAVAAQGNRRSKPTEADTPDTTPGHTVGEPVGMAAFHELERQLKAQQPEHSGGGT